MSFNLEDFSEQQAQYAAASNSLERMMDMGGMAGGNSSEVLQRSIQLIQNNSQVSSKSEQSKNITHILKGRKIPYLPQEHWSLYKPYI